MLLTSQRALEHCFLTYIPYAILQNKQTPLPLAFTITSVRAGDAVLELVRAHLVGGRPLPRLSADSARRLHTLQSEERQRLRAVGREVARLEYRLKHGNTAVVERAREVVFAHCPLP